MRIFIFLFIALQLSFVHASVEFRQFDKVELEARYNVLVDELRCLVCQNQNLKDSNSDLAKDMRDKVYQMISAGKTNQQIVDFMVARYGDFVLYKPPFKTITLLLWLGPLLFLVIAMIVLFRIIKQRNQTMPSELTDAEHQRAQKLLKKDDTQ
ncbi:Cytochrome c heme lyase subunit CcmL [hydrothermal vent metagenome]|uniref:Cytochrome c heme lyase subunit CcmL n=1 Tax=hydrothermal vent metagenome TaxID=652676 RepID=A0A3B1AIG5_9ZZZZ